MLVNVGVGRKVMKNSTQKKFVLLGAVGFLALVAMVATKGSLKLEPPKPKMVSVGRSDQWMLKTPGSSGSRNFFAQPRSPMEADAKTANAQAETLQRLGFSATEVSSVSVGVKK
jgi:hypothetical protein